MKLNVQKHKTVEWTCINKFSGHRIVPRRGCDVTCGPFGNSEKARIEKRSNKSFDAGPASAVTTALRIREKIYAAVFSH